MLCIGALLGSVIWRCGSPDQINHFIHFHSFSLIFIHIHLFSFIFINFHSFSFIFIHFHSFSFIFISTILHENESFELLPCIALISISGWPPTDVLVHGGRDGGRAGGGCLLQLGRPNIHHIAGQTSRQGSYFNQRKIEKKSFSAKNIKIKTHFYRLGLLYFSFV